MSDEKQRTAEPVPDSDYDAGLATAEDGWLIVDPETGLAGPRSDNPSPADWADRWCAAFNVWALTDDDSPREVEAEIALWALRDEYEAWRATRRSK